MEIYEASEGGKICRYRLLLGEKVLFPLYLEKFTILNFPSYFLNQPISSFMFKK